MEFANQYGINLPAIDQAISAKKTAEQNMKMNDMKMNALTKEQERQDQLESADTNIKNELYPKSKAVTLQQAREEEAIANAQKEYKLKQNLVAHQQVATHIADLINQPDAIKIPTVQNNLRQLQQTNPEQFAFSMSKLPKIGSGDINDPEYIKQIIPYMAKDVFDDATKAQHAYEEHKAELKHKQDMELWGERGKNALTIQSIKGKTAEEIAQEKAQNALSLQKYKTSHPSSGGKLTEGDKNVQALMEANPGMTANQARYAIMQGNKTTNVDDPIYGKKIVTSKKTFGELKPPPPMEKSKVVNGKTYIQQNGKWYMQ